MKVEVRIELENGRNIDNIGNDTESEHQNMKKEEKRALVIAEKIENIIKEYARIDDEDSYEIETFRPKILKYCARP